MASFQPTMASAASSSTPCDHSSQQPIEIGCAHTICANCGIVNETNSTIGCSQCPYIVPRPTHGFAGLPPNWRLIRRIQADRLLKGEVQCDVELCDEAATHVCLACHEAKPLCAAHAAGHMKKKRSHKVVEGASSVAHIPPVMCPAHPNRTPDHYCHDCVTLVCCACTDSGKHKDHTVAEIDAAHATIRATMAESEVALRASQEQAVAMIPTIDALVVKMQEQATAMTVAIEAAVIELHRMVDEWKQRQLEAGPRTQAKNVKLLATHRDMLRVHVDEAVNMAETLRDYAQHAEAVDMLAVFPALARGTAWHLAKPASLPLDIVKNATWRFVVDEIKTTMEANVTAQFTPATELLFSCIAAAMDDVSRLRVLLSRLVDAARSGEPKHVSNSPHDALRLKLVDDGAAACIATVLQRHPSDVDVCSAALEASWLLARAANNQPKLLDAGVLDQALAVMSTHADDADIARHVMNLIIWLGNNVEFRTGPAAVSTIPLIMAALRFHANNATVMRSGLWALRNIAQHAANHVALVAAGARDIARAALDTHVGVAGVVDHATPLLRTLGGRPR